MVDRSKYSLFSATVAILFLLALAIPSQDQIKAQSLCGPYIGAKLERGSLTPIPTFARSQGCGAKATSLPLTPLSYFDPKLPIYDWGVGLNYTPFLMEQLGQRFTLPNNSSGFLDSVRILVDSLPQDSIHVSLIGDTLFTTPAGTFHLMNRFDATLASYGEAFINASQVHGPTEVTVHFKHVRVPQEFWVVLTPNLDTAQSQLTTYAFIPGDSSTVVPRTAGNTRTSTLVIYNGGAYVFLLDSLIQANGGGVIYSNLYMTAYASVAGGGVASASNNGNLVVYPNPASSDVNISGEPPLASASVELVDMLGRQVIPSQPYTGGRLDVSGLPNGHYLAIIRASQANFTTPVIVGR